MSFKGLSPGYYMVLTKRIKMLVISHQNDFFIKVSLKLHVLVENYQFSMSLSTVDIEYGVVLWGENHVLRKNMLI